MEKKFIPKITVDLELFLDTWFFFSQSGRQIWSNFLKNY